MKIKHTSRKKRPAARRESIVAPKKPTRISKKKRFAPASRVPAGIGRYLRPEEIGTVDVRMLELPNGLKVVSEHVLGASSLAVGLWVRTGSRHEPVSKGGIAHFIEHVVFKGTAGHSMREIMRSIESKGGVLNAYTTKEHTCYYTWTRTIHLREAVSILFELAQKPNFSPRDIEREKAVVIEEINGIEDEPDELVFDLFDREVFGNTPLGRPILGSEKSVHSFDRKSLLDFHKHHYRPQDLVIVASGAHDHEELFSAIREAANRRLSQHERPVQRKAPPGESNGREKTITKPGGNQAHIIVGRRAPGIHSSEYFAISALVTLLGVGMGSRLNLRLREEMGLAYDATAFYSPFEDAGTVGIYVAASAENHDRVVRQMKTILRGLFTKPISEIELERTKEQLIGGLVLPLESVSNRMMRAGQSELYFRKYQPVEEDIAKIASLTLAKVRRVANDLFLDESKLILVSVVPEAEE